MKKGVLLRKVLAAVFALVMFSLVKVPVSAEAAATVTEKKLGTTKNYDSVGNTIYEDNYLIVMKDGKYGVINLKGKEVIKCEYDSISHLNGSWLANTYYEKQTIFSMAGKKLYTHECSDWWSDSISFGYNDLAVITSDGKYGLLNTRGELAAECKYDYLSYVGDYGRKANFFAGTIDGKYDIIDGTTGQKIAGGYDTCRKTAIDNIVIVEKNGKYGLVNNTGEYVKCQYSSIGYDEFKYGNSSLQYSSFLNGTAAVCKNNKWGFINSDGKVVVKLNYDDAREFSEGLAAVKKDDKWGYINEKGKEVIKPIYSLVYDFKNGTASVTGNGNIVINKKGEQVSSNSKHFDYIGEYHDGLAAAKEYEEDPYYVYIDKKNNTVIQSVDGFVDTVQGYIVDAGQFSEGLAAVEIYDPFIGERTGNDYYYINTKGKIVLKGYQNAYAFKNGFGEVKKDYNTGAVNKKGKEIIPCEFNGISTYENGLAVFYKRDADWSYTYGLANTSGIILKCNYQSIKVYPELNVVIAKKNDKYAVLNNKGKAITKYSYSEFVGVDGENIIFKNGTKYVVVNKNGKTAATMKNKYSVVSTFNDGVGFGISNGNLYKITLK